MQSRLNPLFTFFFALLLSLFFSFIPKKAVFASSTTRFIYDGNGDRVAKIVDGKVTLYIGDMEKDPQTGKITKYYTHKGVKVAYKEDGQLFYIGKNHLTSSSFVTDVNGIKTSQSYYYPYGSNRPRVGQTAVAISRQYTSQIKDFSTELYFYNARYYNPNNGAFIQADSLSKSLNKYTYAANNPMRFSDSSGNEPNDPVETLATLLCEAEGRSGCDRPDPRIYGREGGMAYRALNMAQQLHEDPTLKASLHYVATVPIPEDLAQEWAKGASRLKTWQGFRNETVAYIIPDLRAMGRATLRRGLNIALFVSMTGAETAFHDPEKVAVGGNHMTNAHMGERLVAYWESQRGDWNRALAVVDMNPNYNFQAAALSFRAWIGYMEVPSGQTQTFSLFEGGKPNWSLIGYFPGSGLSPLWVPRVKSYYGAFEKFVGLYPEYSWMLGDLLEYERPRRGGPQAE